MQGSAVFARFLKESSKDAQCYKTAICTPSHYHLRMLIKAKHRSAALHSLGEIYSLVCRLCAFKASCEMEGNISAFTMGFT